MVSRIELPEDLVHDLDQEAVRRQVSVVEIIREALHTWRISREAGENDREWVRQILQDRGLLCQLPTELAAHAQPLTVEELDQLATKAAKAGPLSELIVQERRGEKRVDALYFIRMTDHAPRLPPQAEAAEAAT